MRGKLNLGLTRSLALTIPLGVSLLGTAQAQNSSLYRQDLPPSGNRVLTTENASLIYQPPVEQREIRLHDIITVIVDQKSQVISEGDAERRKRAHLKASLDDWVQLVGLDIKAAPQRNGSPTISGRLDSQIRAESDIETRDGMKFKIAATVVDIRPNGTMVIEAHSKFLNNEENWQFSLIGTIRKEDILPNNTILSEDIAGLEIHKREFGQVRDGYRRGWITRLYDRFLPF